MTVRESESGTPFTLGGPDDRVQPAREAIYARGGESPPRHDRPGHLGEASPTCVTRPTCTGRDTSPPCDTPAHCSRLAQAPTAAAPLRKVHHFADREGAGGLRLEAEALATTARISLIDPESTGHVRAPTTGPLAQLTNREREVLDHLVAGRTYAEIAAALFVSEKTVSTHVSNLLRKTATSSRLEVSALALRLRDEEQQPGEDARTCSSASRFRTRRSTSSRTGRTAATSMPCGVVERPVLVALAGEDRAGVAAAHGDHDVGGLDDLVGPGLGVLPGDVDAALGHGRDRGGVHLVAGFGPTGPGQRGVAGVVLEEAEGHLGPTRVVGAEEQHDRASVVRLVLDPRQGLEPLPGEPLGEERQEVGHGGLAGELVVRRGQEALDRLDAERVAELRLESGGGGPEGELLVEGEQG